MIAEEHKEKEITTPLQELSRRILYRIDVLKDTYAAQVELLEGSEECSAEYSSEFKDGNSSSSGQSKRKMSSRTMICFFPFSVFLFLLFFFYVFVSILLLYDFTGLKVQLNDLENEHENLMIRIKLIQDRGLQQQKRLQQVYSAALITRTKVRKVHINLFFSDF